MPNDVIDAFRQKYPVYGNVPDDILTAQIADKYPAYKQNLSFAADLERIKSAKPLSEPAAPFEEPPSLSERMQESVGGVEKAVMGPIGKALALVGNIPAMAYNAAGRLTGKLAPVDMPFEQGKAVLPQAFYDAIHIQSEMMFRPKDIMGFPVSQPTPFSTGMANAIKKTAEGFTTPEGIAMLPLLESTIGKVAMGTVMASQTPEQVRNTAKTFADPNATPTQKWEALGDAGINIAMMAGLAYGLKPGEVKAQFTPEQAAKVAEEAHNPPVLEQPPGHIDEILALQPTPEPAKSVEEPPLAAKADAIAPVAPLTAEAVKGIADVSANVPLGLNRNDVIDPRLRNLSDEEFDAVHAKANESVYHLEKAMDEGQPFDRNELAKAQDHWNAADNERFRRNNADVSPTDLFRKLLDEPNPTKQLILMAELDRQKASLDEMLSETQFHHPDDEEIFKGKLEQLRDTLRKQNLTNEGGSQTDLPPEQQAISKANNSREAWAGMGFDMTTDAATKAKSSAEEIFNKPQDLGPSMGGVTPSDPVEPVGKGNSGNPDIYGVAERVREERAKAGQVNRVEPGIGISAPDSVERGRELLKVGSDPEKTLSNFEQTKRLSADDMALVRAKGEELAASARRIEEKFGTHSPEYKLAFDALSSWDKRSKAMQTEWAKTGQAQQGETDIDTGSFTGLQRAYKDATGKDFTPQQATTAQSKADASNKANVESTEAKRKLYAEVSKEPIVDPKIKSIADRIVAALDKTANDALARIKARRRRLTIGLDPADLADHAIYGASKIAKGTIEFSKWSAEMVKDLGDYVKPHLKEIWDAADKQLDEQIANATNATTRDAVRQAVKKKTTPRTLEQIKQVLADHKPGTPFANDQVKALWERAKVYLDQGMDDFDDVRNKLATDLGISANEATKGLTQPQSVKRLANDVWKKQQDARRLKQTATRWLQQTATPRYLRAIQSIPKALFSIKVGFHGTVALGTHAPMVAFQPPFWKTYVTDFGRMYKMVGSPAYYERTIQDLMRRENYITARRAGLVNDPSTFEDFNSPQVSEKFGRLTGMGNRGYAVLKVLRQDMFDQHWGRLPETTQTPEVAKAIADGINHATGVVKSKAPAGSNIVLFAPRLAASRVAWLAVDPAKAAMTFADWKNAQEADRQFAINQVKEKAWVLGTAFGLLALNQGFLSATDSKQKINFDDPMKGDFLKFKGAGMVMSYGNPMLTMARLPVRLYAIRKSDGGKLKNIVHPDESSYTVLGEYARSQLSPFGSLSSDLWFKSDWMNRPLPNSNRAVPKRLAAQGIGKYTWPEFWSEQLLPIPAEEAVKEVWQSGLGMSDDQMSHARKALATIAVMSATGARLSEDHELKKP